jgi:hypothetical protein
MRAAPRLEHRTPRLLPETEPGRWSLGLFGVVVAGFVFMTAALAGGQQGGDAFGDNQWLAVPAAVAALAAIASGAVGGFSILRRHEHAGLIYLTTAMGLLVTVFVVGELTA